jgi:hypothetical protein
MYLNCGHQLAHRSPPRWYTSTENHSGMISTGDGRSSKTSSNPHRHEKKHDNLLILMPHIYLHICIYDYIFFATAIHICIYHWHWWSSVVYRLSFLPSDPRFASSNPAEDDGFLRAIKIRSTTSFRGESKLMVPFRKILWHVKLPYIMKEILVGQIHGHFSQSFSYFVTRCLLVTARELWLVKQEWVELTWEAQYISNGGSVWVAMCDTTPWTVAVSLILLTTVHNGRGV